MLGTKKIQASYRPRNINNYNTVVVENAVCFAMSLEVVLYSKCIRKHYNITILFSTFPAHK